MCASYDCIAIMHFSTINSSNDDKSVLSTESFQVFTYQYFNLFLCTSTMIYAICSDTYKM